jgi:hypothetical protein
MNYITGISIGWKQLRAILSEIVLNLNTRTPLAGNGITVSEYPNGCLIALKAHEQTAASAALEDKGSIAAWHQLAVIDSTDCSKKYIWYWGTKAVSDQTRPHPKTYPVSTS